MQYDDVAPIGWTKRAVLDVAEKLAAAWNLEPGEPLDGLVKKLGGNVEYQDAFTVDTSKDGSIRIDDRHDFRIFVPDYVSYERNRFTIAHEIGHYVLHYVAQKLDGRQVKAARASGPNQERAEREADWFASGLLMPKDDFLKVCEDSSADLTSVARKFGVSTQAAKWQLDYYNVHRT
jgi:predicted transcriptional regulator